MKYFDSYQNLEACSKYIEFIGEVSTPSRVDPRLRLNKANEVAREMLSGIKKRLKKIPKEFELSDRKNLVLNKIFKIVDDIQDIR